MVKTQVMSAPATTLAAGIVKVEPLSEPNDAGFPVTALLESVHVAEVMAKPVACVSVIWTCDPIVVTLIAVGDAGVAVAAVVVVMLGGVLARLTDEKLKAPPTLPAVIFCTFSVGVLLLVRTQVMSAPLLTLVVGTVSVEPESVPNVPVLPVTELCASVQDTADATKVEGAVSVAVIAVPMAVATIEVGVVGVAVFTADVVMEEGVELRLVWLKLNEPVPPRVFFCKPNLAFLVLVKVQLVP